MNNNQIFDLNSFSYWTVRSRWTVFNSHLIQDSISLLFYYSGLSSLIITYTEIHFSGIKQFELSYSVVIL
jgi:hypothetical protein